MTLTAVPETCQLHAFSNMGTQHEVNMRRVLCCCRPCMKQQGQCENIDICDEWKAFNMQSKKSVPVSWTLWEGQLNCHNTCIPQATKTWEQRLNDMSFRDFEQLEQYIVRNPLPEMERLTIDDAMLQSDKDLLDFVALHHLPKDAPDGYAPVKYLVMVIVSLGCVATLLPNTRKDIQNSEFKLFMNWYRKKMFISMISMYRKVLVLSITEGQQ